MQKKRNGIIYTLIWSFVLYYESLGDCPGICRPNSRKFTKGKRSNSLLDIFQCSTHFTRCLFSGEILTCIFRISINSLKIAGGLIIASSGFALLTGKFAEHKGMKRQKVEDDIKKRSEITLTPLAIPMLAGPGTISLLITYNQAYDQTIEIATIIGSMLATTGVIYLILKSAFLIVKKLGASGINALSRIIGFVVISIGVEYIISATINLIKIHFYL